MIADFWTFDPAGTWPLASVGFLILIACVLVYALWQHLERDHKAIHPKEHKHFHEDKQGILHACYHACKQQNLFFSKMYWISLTLAFPIEHIVYHKLWPFYLLSNWLNIG